MAQQPTNPTPARPKPPVPPEHMKEGAIAKLAGPALVQLLNEPAASEFQKAKACQRAGEFGAVEAIPALARLLGDEKLGSYARYCLELMSSPAVDETLRGALGKLKGNLLIGVIGSISKRRDALALAPLTKLIQDPNTGIAEAAVAAVGSIGTAESARLLQSALPKATGRMQMQLADAALVCAEQLLAAGKRDQALELYAFLSGPKIPRAARLGAMSAIVREETSTKRPRPTI